MFVFAGQSQSFGKLIKDGVRFYKTAFAKVLFLVLVMAVISNGLSPHILKLDFHQQQQLYVLAVFLNTFVMIYFLCAIYKKMYLLGKQQPETLTNILRSVFPDFLIVIIAKIAFIVLLLLLMIISFLVSAICVAIPLLPITLIFSLSHQFMLHLGLIITAIIGAIVFISCFIFLHISFLFYIPLILFDRAGPLDVIGKSLSFIRGNWWRTLTVVAIAFLLATIVFAPFYLLLFHHFRPYFHQANLTEPYMFNVWWAILNVVVSLFLVPWISAVVLVLYNDLKLRVTAQPSFLRKRESLEM